MQLLHCSIPLSAAWLISCRRAEMNAVVEREEYEAPKLETHGSIEAITQGASTGSFLDRDFPVGTVFGDLTFS